MCGHSCEPGEETADIFAPGFYFHLCSDMITEWCFFCLPSPCTEWPCQIQMFCKTIYVQRDTTTANSRLTAVTLSWGSRSHLLVALPTAPPCHQVAPGCRAAAVTRPSLAVLLSSCFNSFSHLLHLFSTYIVYGLHKLMKNCNLQRWINLYNHLQTHLPNTPWLFCIPFQMVHKHPRF